MRYLIFILSLFVATTQAQIVSSTVYFSSAEPSGPVNMISNGTFNGATGWTVGASWSVAGDIASYTCCNESEIDQADGDMIASIEADKDYRITFDLVAASGTDITILNTAGNVAYIAEANYTTSSFSEDFHVSGSPLGGGLAISAWSGGGSCTVDNVVLIDITE